MKRKKNLNKNPSKKVTIHKELKKNSLLSYLLSQKNDLLPLLIIFILGILIYSNTFDAPLQFDDTLQIVAKSRVKDINNFLKLSEWTDINKRPLAFYTFALNYYFAGYQVLGYHIVNILIHIISTLVVFYLSKIIFMQTSNTEKSSSFSYNIASLFAALIFLTHPIQTQSVTYIVQRMTSLAGMFYLIAVLCYAKGRILQINSNKTKAIVFYMLTLLASLLSLLSKQIAVTLPFTFLLLEFFYIRNKQGKPFKKYLIVSFISLIIIGLAITLSGFLPSETENITRQQYLITQFRVMIKYFQLLILPIGQNVDYYFPLSESLWNWKELTSLFGVLAIIGSAIYMYRKLPVYAFGIFWIFITLSVESSIIPIRDVIFEHRLYLPMFGFSLIIVGILTHYLRKVNRKITSAILIILLLFYSALTFNRNKVWASQYSLWTDVTRKSPEKPRPWYNLGKIVLDEGKFNESIKYLQNSIKLDPDQPDAWYNIGFALESNSKYEQAEGFYKKALEYDSNHTRSMNNLGSLYINHQKYQEAVYYLLKAYEIENKQPAILQNLGVAYYNLGDYKNAIKYNKKLLKLQPDNAIIMSDIGLSYLQLQKYDKAINSFNESLQLKPDRITTLLDLGTSYFYKEDYTKALESYTKALELDPKNTLAKQYLQTTRSRIKQEP